MHEPILLVTKVPHAFLKTLTDRYDVIGPLETPFTTHASALAPADAARVRAILTIGSVHFPPELLDLFPNLGLSVAWAQASRACRWPRRAGAASW